MNPCHVTHGRPYTRLIVVDGIRVQDSDGDAGQPRSSFVRKAATAGVGGAVTAAGIVMLVTPGPGILVSLAGLGILAREFPSAAAAVERLRGRRRNDTGGDR